MGKYYGQEIYIPGTPFYNHTHKSTSKIVYRSYFINLGIIFSIFNEEDFIKTFIIWNMEMRMKSYGIQSFKRIHCRTHINSDLNTFFLYRRKMSIIKLIPKYYAILDCIPIPEELGLEIVNYL